VMKCVSIPVQSGFQETYLISLFQANPFSTLFWFMCGVSY
jgi:hypothetical protein